MRLANYRAAMVTKALIVTCSAALVFGALTLWSTQAEKSIAAKLDRALQDAVDHAESRGPIRVFLKIRASAADRMGRV
jgi:hypothetical protein